MKVLSKRSHAQKGYSIIEMLVVVAIIGTLSLITVPSFISFSRTSKVRAASRQLASDIRWARQRAITQSRRTAITFATGAAAAGQYELWDRLPSGAWTRIKVGRIRPAATDPIYFQSTGFTNATEANGDAVAGDDRPDVLFLPNGTVGNIPNSTPTVVFKTDHAVAKPTVTITFRASGNFRVE